MGSQTLPQIFYLLDAMEKHKPISCFAILSPKVPENRLWIIVCPLDQTTANGTVPSNDGGANSLNDRIDTGLILNQGILNIFYMQTTMKNYKLKIIN